MTTVLYVGGYGRSGSTLLDTLLGSHSQVLGAGELEMFFKDVVADGCCTCGRSYPACPIWGEVLSDLETNLDHFDLEELASTLARTESTRGFWSMRPRSTRRRYGRVWHELFDAAVRHSGAEVVVDSSKSSRGSSRRISLLADDSSLEMVVIHLIRDPRAVLYSERRRGNNDRLEARSRTLQSLGGVLRPLIGWAMANVAVTITRRRLPHLRVLRVHYEDLVADPGRELERIGRVAELDFSKAVDRIEQGEAFDPGHGVRGNRMRRSGPIRLQADEEWMRKSDLGYRLVGLPFAPLAYFYGYNLIRRPRPSSSVS